MKVTIKKRIEVDGQIFEPGTYVLTNELAAKVIKMSVKQKIRKK
jgi:hypothetical protein